MIFFRIILLLLYIFAPLHAKTNEEISAFLPRFEEKLKKIQDDYRAPGLAIAIVKGNDVIFQKTLGVKESGTTNAINEETIFQIASNTKVFLAFVIAQLVEEGVLSWDTPVHKYIPELVLTDAEAQKNITLIDLLTHRIGLPPFTGDMMWHLRFSPVELINSLRHIQFKYGFREQYTYQNCMFAIAGLLVERATGKRIEQLFSERIFVPLDMKHASVGMDALKSRFFGVKKINFAFPHDVRNGAVYTKPLLPHMYLYPGSSGINLSLVDAIKWLKFLMNDYVYKGRAFLKKETIAFMRSPKTQMFLSDNDLQFPKERFSENTYGVGIFKNKYGQEQKFDIFSHMGGFNGVRSYMCFLPELNLGMIILSNYGSMRVSLMPEVIRNTFLDWYMGLDTIDWLDKIHGTEMKWRALHKDEKLMSRVQRPLPARDYNEYVGAYHHDIFGTLNIKHVDGKLYMCYQGKDILLNHFNGDDFDIKPYELDEGYNDYDTCPVYFRRNDHGEFRVFVGNMSEGHAYFEKEIS